MMERCPLSSLGTYPNATILRFEKLCVLHKTQQKDVQTVLLTSIANGVGRLFARTT